MTLNPIAWAWALYRRWEWRRYDRSLGEAERWLATGRDAYLARFDQEDIHVS